MSAGRLATTRAATLQLIAALGLVVCAASSLACDSPKDVAAPSEGSPNMAGFEGSAESEDGGSSDEAGSSSTNTGTGTSTSTSTEGEGDAGSGEGDSGSSETDTAASETDTGESCELDIELEDTACVACTMAACCPELTDCLEVDACVCALECIEAGGQASSCQLDCEAQDPVSVALGSCAIVNCIQVCP
ncbi:hypothetical protein G6O69_15540 [Pseudenhygromyxa sp. WMMC2535]|uniref:hypothetical protein n=1 Tax=Pseudenhygromyxa sp. WMMC2535 TaxID=2712867 RepID=UPI001553C571|nr:hypothetical protein [Pseudenhygromyxa sp. WMMC2535]NVB39256.1 hypothetical protein [Pseudenhygromyxa sp. WMMC2535]